MSFMNMTAGYILPAAPKAAENNSAHQIPLLSSNLAVVQQSNGKGFGAVSEGTFQGELSIGFMALIVIGFVVFYAWTRNVQGGG